MTWEKSNLAILPGFQHCFARLFSCFFRQSPSAKFLHAAPKKYGNQIPEFNFMWRYIDLRIIILGGGSIGGSVAKELSSEENDVVVIDNNNDHLEEIKNKEGSKEDL